MSRLSQKLSTLSSLWHYQKAKGLQKKLHTWSREELETYQQKRLDVFKKMVLQKSPYFKPYMHLPMGEWPLMDKAVMMENFDRMNTAGLKKEALFACAFQAEENRDFEPMLHGFSVGLSSGTSGTRGLFVASPQERVWWSSSILAKMLPQGLFAGERIALFLRADNQLYQNINSRWLSLAFFDLFDHFETQCERLQKYKPSILVAPAQVLRAIALKKQAGGLDIDPLLVISAAEVLTPSDKTLLQQTFKKVGEVYQATEGFLGATCQHGTLHLNEEYVHIEPDWLDEDRFTPIVTDFTRQTQPIVRYRLDDVLVRSKQECPCGSPAMALERIEGRCDDQLQLPSLQSEGVDVTVFADVCQRVLAQTLPLHCDYQLIHRFARSQGKKTKHQLVLTAPVAVECLQATQQKLLHLFETQGVKINALQWELHSKQVDVDLTRKRRRIVCINDEAEKQSKCR